MCRINVLKDTWEREREREREREFTVDEIKKKEEDETKKKKQANWDSQHVYPSCVCL